MASGAAATAALDGATATATATPPVPVDQLVVLVNGFVESTVAFVNDLAAVCEARLGDVARRVARVEATVRLLEAEVAGAVAGQAAQASGDVAAAVEAAGPTPTHLPTAVLPIPPPATATATTPPAPTTTPTTPTAGATPSPRNTTTNAASSDPRAEKYRRMLRVGVDRGAVLAKMRADGVDESLL